MNLFKEPCITRAEFRRALNVRCYKDLGLGLIDLPDIICIDEVWWEGQNEKEAIKMIDGCLEDFKEELTIAN